MVDLGEVFLLTPNNPSPNLEIGWGDTDKDGSFPILFSLQVKRTFINRFKYWMLCSFFPFKISRWDKEEDVRRE